MTDDEINELHKLHTSRPRMEVDSVAELATAEDVACLRAHADRLDQLSEVTKAIAYVADAHQSHAARLRRLANSAAAMLTRSDDVERWYIGAMNDGPFIINKRPRPSNDDAWHDRPDGPTMAISVAGLTQAKIKEIVDAHNATLAGVNRTPAPGAVTEAQRREIAEAWFRVCSLDKTAVDWVRMENALRAAGLLEDERHG